MVDGTGKEPYRADVLIQRNIIASIGNIKEHGSAKTIEGLGNYLTPGFIDLNGEPDHHLSLFSNPEQKEFLNQGVTTVLGGQSGSSLAPIHYGSLESIRKWADVKEINVNWNTLEEFLEELDKLRLGINFGTLVGHSTIRRDLVKSRKTLDKEELEIMENILKRSLDEGGFGLSSGLNFIHGKKSSLKELAELNRVVAKMGMVHFIDLPDYGKDILKWINQIVGVVERGRANTIINNFKPVKGYEKEFEKALRIVESTDRLGFSISPQGVSQIQIYTLLPEFALKNDLISTLEEIRKPGVGKKIENYWKKSKPNYKNIRVISAPKHHFLIGRTVAEVAKNWGTTQSKALLELMKMCELQATATHGSVPKKYLRELVTNKKAYIGSGSNGLVPGMGSASIHPANHTFLNFIDTAVGKNKFGIEAAIKKITGDAASLIGLSDRGLIKEGMIADLVLLDKSGKEVKEVIIGGSLVSDGTNRGEILSTRK